MVSLRPPERRRMLPLQLGLILDQMLLRNRPELEFNEEGWRPFRGSMVLRDLGVFPFEPGSHFTLEL
jgi:hypothetical protein